MEFQGEIAAEGAVGGGNEVEAAVAVGPQTDLVVENLEVSETLGDDLLLLRTAKSPALAGSPGKLEDRG